MWGSTPKSRVTCSSKWASQAPLIDTTYRNLKTTSGQIRIFWGSFYTLRKQKIKTSKDPFSTLFYHFPILTKNMNNLFVMCQPYKCRLYQTPNVQNNKLQDQWSEYQDEWVICIKEFSSSLPKCYSVPTGGWST